MENFILGIFACYIFLGFVTFCYVLVKEIRDGVFSLSKRDRVKWYSVVGKFFLTIFAWFPILLVGAID